MSKQEESPKKDQSIDAIVTFWFLEKHQSLWFVKNSAFDKTIAENFLPFWEKASRGELYHWRDTLKGRLAEIIVLDQFSRNLFRGSKEAFSQDLMALVLAQEALLKKEFSALPLNWRLFTLIPLMHAESRVIQEKSLLLFGQYTNKRALKLAREHKEIIDRFGRFPHRNNALGRFSTPDEKVFLKENPSGF